MFRLRGARDAIDFVGRLFQLSPYDTAQKLMTDFHLSPDKPPSVAVLHAKRIRTEAQRLMENGRLFTVNGLIEDEGQIGNLIPEEISGLSKIVTNLLAGIKLQAYSPTLSIETDRIHIANGTYFMDGSLTADKGDFNRWVRKTNAMLREAKK